MTRCATESGSCGWSAMSVQRRLPALQDGSLVVLAHAPRAIHPRSELGLWVLSVGVLELDAVGVALLQVLEDHLACHVVLVPLRDGEVDLDERVGVAVE